MPGWRWRRSMPRWKRLDLRQRQQRRRLASAFKPATRWWTKALIVLMPSDHRLTSREAIHPREFVGEIFIGGSKKAAVLRAVTEDYLRRSGLDIKLDHGVDSVSTAMSLVASMRGLALMPAYAQNLLPWSVVSRPLEGEAPTIDLAVGYSKANTSPILKLFLSRIEELRAPMPEKKSNVSA